MFLLAIPIDAVDSDIQSFHPSLVEHLRIFEYVGTINSYRRTVEIQHCGHTSKESEFDCHNITLSLVDDSPLNALSISRQLKNIKRPCLVLQTPNDYERKVESNAAIFSMILFMDGFAFFRVESLTQTPFTKYLHNAAILSINGIFDNIKRRLQWTSSSDSSGRSGH